MADLSALVPLVQQLKAAGYQDWEIPEIIRKLHAQFIAPTQSPVLNVAGGYGLLDPAVNAARVAADLAVGTGNIGLNLLNALLGIQRDPFSIVPAFQAYGALGGSPNQATAVLMGRQGVPLEILFGNRITSLIDELLRRATEPVKTQEEKTQSVLTKEQEAAVRAAYARDPVAAERFFREATRNPEGVAAILRKAEEDRRRVLEAFQRDPVAAQRFFEEAARNPEGVRRMFGGAYARGGSLVINEPAIIQGLTTGRPYGLLGEVGPEEVRIMPLYKLPSRWRGVLPPGTRQRPVFPPGMRTFARGGTIIAGLRPVKSGSNRLGSYTVYKGPGRTVVKGSNVARTLDVLGEEKFRALKEGGFANLKRLKNLNLSRLGELLQQLPAQSTSTPAAPPEEAAPPVTTPSEPPPAVASPEPPPVAISPATPPAVEVPAQNPIAQAAISLFNALRGHTLFPRQGFLDILAGGGLPTVLPSPIAFATLSPVLREALLGFLTQASGGTLTREQILNEIAKSAPGGFGSGGVRYI